MSITYKNGDILNAPEPYICHQVNCMGVMGAGLAKQIRERWPAVYDVYKLRANSDMLGKITLVNIQNGDHITSVVNMFAQNDYGRDRRYTSYDAFWCCLGEIREKIPKGSSIAFPNKIGCGLGGGDWTVIETMINVVLGDDYNIVFYTL